MGQTGGPGLRAWRHPRVVAGTLALTTIMLLAGCGGDGDTGAATSPAAQGTVHWTLVLDYEPNAVHAGLLRAQTAGYFTQAGIDLKIVAPSSTSDALTQVSRGKAQLGLADLIDVARRNEPAAAADRPGLPPIAVVGAVVQRPLSGLLVNAGSDIATPADLAGKRIAVSGLPSDLAVVKVMIQRDGRPLGTKPITLGFNGLKALHAGRVDASTAYWPADAVTLAQLGTKPRTFALDEFGGPRYPGLVAFAGSRLALRDRAHVQAFAAALAHGERDVVADPAVGEQAVQDSYPELDAQITRAQLKNYVPLFGDAASAGTLNDRDLTAFTAFAHATGLTTVKLTVPQLTGSAAAATTP